ncbi:DUF1073 domain-containing protein [Commensalibacter oyaizuii]|uniref:DUF1073 domain-containing protein n=1 Tax=Commensalibacter oyaizuii TaxID=3043873 RepID=A0ABT6Q3H3_9PROT|nr:DUF1073 domain-containing protein [Commensalibacter sp. TBRC 16381]MDI2091672.1 DUF1073 domain-containing protein [Commensalibacter sp. TBRC 16381]
MVKKTKLKDVYVPYTQVSQLINKQDVFSPYEVPEGIVGEHDECAGVSDSMFMDQFRNFNVTNNPVTTLFEEGIGFPGYPYLAQLSLRGEYRMIVETRAEEATREWITFRQISKKIAYSDRLDKIQTEFKRLDIQGIIRQALCKEGYFGLSYLYIDLKTAQNSEDEKSAPLFLSSKKINKGDLKGIKLIDPTWVTPVAYNAIDPFADDFYTPSLWWVLGQQVHASRLISIVSQPVPDILKPAYNFGGVPFAFMCKPYVDNWLRTRQSVSDLIKSFSTMVLKTDLSQLLSPGCEELSKRAELMAAYRDNRGLQIVDKETEDLANIATPLSGLDKLQAQSQEHMASISGIPLVKLLGITPSGLNASSDGEVRCFYDKIAALQESVLRAPLEMILRIVQLHLFGDIDENITFDFNSLWQIDEVEQSQVEVNIAKTLTDYVERNVLTSQQVQEILQNSAKTSLFSNINLM